MHHPAVALLLAEVDHVGLRPDQQTELDAVQAALEKQTAVLNEPRTELSRHLADGVAAGKLDRSKIDADAKKVADAAESTVKTVQDAANRLHATLDPSQRRKLVDLIRQRAEQMQAHAAVPMHGPATGRHATGATGEVPSSAQAIPPGPHAVGQPDMHTHMGVDRLSEILGLTQDQREQLRAKVEARMKSQMGAMKNVHATMHKRMRAIADAFIADKFDAKKAGVGERHADMMKNMLKARVEFVETVLSVLTPEQRPKFAEHIRKHCELCDEPE